MTNIPMTLTKAVREEERPRRLVAVQVYRPPSPAVTDWTTREPLGNTATLPEADRSPPSEEGVVRRGGGG